MQNILVKIGDLTQAIYVLNCAGFKATVVASGSMWATIEMDYDMRVALNNRKIHWQFDN